MRLSGTSQSRVTLSRTVATSHMWLLAFEWLKLNTLRNPFHRHTSHISRAPLPHGANGSQSGQQSYETFHRCSMFSQTVLVYRGADTPGSQTRLDPRWYISWRLCDSGGTESTDIHSTYNYRCPGDRAVNRGSSCTPWAAYLRWQTINK